MRQRRASSFSRGALVALILALLPLAPASAADPIAPSPVPHRAERTPTRPAVAPATSPDARRVAQPADAGRPVMQPDATNGRPLLRGGGLDARGRYIVVLRPGADLSGVVAREKRHGAKVERTFRRSFHGFVAIVGAAGRARLAKDPAVKAVVPDEIVTIAGQSIPTGIRRVRVSSSEVAQLDGIDQGVDADVAIVDTGIDATHPDLKVVGGYNCSTPDRSQWRDRENHGTHVAGTVGARDNGIGVVGVAPGVRLWAVKILNDQGFGYLSWYVCGLDWITAQRDPMDPSRPLFEAVNMSVAKSGSDDSACGTRNNDILHRAICRVVAAGIPVVAAAGNDHGSAAAHVPAAYNEVITVSALADTDGLPGGKGGPRCYSWGGYDQDDTLADFSNYGADVDLIAPGKCIWSTIPGNRYAYMSGTSMATPHVTGAVALYKATRPMATVSEVKTALQYLGTYGWRYWTDKDPYHEKLLDVSRLDRLGDFGLSFGTPTAVVGEDGGTLSLPVKIARSASFFERVGLTLAAEAPLTATFSTGTSLFGFTATSATVKVTIPAGTQPGSYTVRVTGTNWGRDRSGSATITVENDVPTARPAVVRPATSTRFDTTLLTARASWPAATDPSSAIGAYQLEYRIDGGTWTGTQTLGATTLSATFPIQVGHTYATHLRARDAVGNWSPWVESPDVRATVVQDTGSPVRYAGAWARYDRIWMSGGDGHSSRQRGASATLTFTGRAVSLVTVRSPTRGTVWIYLDGKYLGAVSTYSREFLSRQIVWSTSWPSSGTHTLKVVVTGTTGHPRIDLDAFVVLQ